MTSWRASLRSSLALYKRKKDPYDSKGYTLRIGCTELKAVPHAGLRFQFLRVRVRTTGSWRSSRGSRAQKEENDRRADKMTSCRASLQSLLALYKSSKVRRKQVRRSGQLRYHQIKWASSLVAVPNDLPLPPAVVKVKRKQTEQIQKDPYDSKGYTHTHTYGYAY